MFSIGHLLLFNSFQIKKTKQKKKQVRTKKTPNEQLHLLLTKSAGRVEEFSDGKAPCCVLSGF